MENRENETPQNARETDISKSQSGQQPGVDQGQSGFGQSQSQSGEAQSGQGGESWQPQTGQGGQPQGGQSGQSGLGGTDQQGSQPGFGTEQADTATQQRSDVEGKTSQTPEQGEAESGFIGTEGSSDTSSELVEEEDYASDGQGAPDEE